MKGVDVGSLKQAVDDALRQTPSVFYIGEVREDADWGEVLRFAGTGHLVIATSHAGSLIEAMERIFRGVKAETPAARGQIAQRLLAVIHQIKFNLSELMPQQMPAPFEVLLPAIWRRTHSGVAALVSDGLSSVLPNAPKEEREWSNVSTFGRRWFAQQFKTDHWTRILERDSLWSLAQAGLEPIRKALGKYAGKDPRDPQSSAAQRFLEELERAFRDFNLKTIRAWARGNGLNGVLKSTGLNELLSAQASSEVKNLVMELCRQVGPSRAHSTAGAPGAISIPDLAESARHHFLIEAIRFDLMGV